MQASTGQCKKAIYLLTLSKSKKTKTSATAINLPRYGQAAQVGACCAVSSRLPRPFHKVTQPSSLDFDFKRFFQIDYLAFVKSVRNVI